MSRVVMSGEATSEVVLVSALRPVPLGLRRVLQPAAAVWLATGWLATVWWATGCLASGWLLAACSVAPPRPPPAAPAATAAPAAAEAPSCVDAKDQRVQCLADADCCPRFVCGKDPELSQSVTYCIFGG